MVCSFVIHCRAAIALLIAGASCAVAAEPAVSYVRDVQPLLSDACYRCHGPDASKREAGLRLDLREASIKPADSKLRAIVPGQPEQSELVRRIFSNDPDTQMPPPDARRQLSDAERQQLRQWIEAGAPFKQHWSFEAIRRPELPESRNSGWCRTPIDRFVLAKLEDVKLTPSTQAEPTTLLRRISFGLTGLPPSTGEVETLLTANSDAETERLLSAAIDSRLGSIAYGEHWARHWMDVVRYADSAGYELDYPFDHSWRFRDWLIRSFQANKPLDRFLQEQLAGDQLWPESEDARDGVLYLAIGPRRFEGGIQRSEEREYEWLTDLADTTGSAILGLTIGCARCHDHKFDVISQRDYFGLHAIFGDCRVEETRLGEKSETSPASLRIVGRDQPASVQLLRRGEITQPIAHAIASFPDALPNGGFTVSDAILNRRTSLAKWITSKDQPLTARVIVNRVWLWHFGKGLVRTPNDFGVQGERPTHPELLDWLAAELIDSGWDLNKLHRMILASATYRMSSIGDESLQQVDPGHRLLTRFPRRRLHAEELQDSLRMVSGRLNLEPFGPPVVPPLEAWALAGLRNANWQPTPNALAAQRRGIYMVVRRSMKLPFFDAFNGPDTVNSCSMRDSTTTPIQALALFNSAESLEDAKALAGHLWVASHQNEALAAKTAWHSLFGRAIREDELESAVRFLRNGQTIAEAGTVPDIWVEWTLLLMNSSEFCYVD